MQQLQLCFSSRKFGARPAQLNTTHQNKKLAPIDVGEEVELQQNKFSINGRSNKVTRNQIITACKLFVTAGPAQYARGFWDYVDCLNCERFMANRVSVTFCRLPVDEISPTPQNIQKDAQPPEDSIDIFPHVTGEHSKFCTG